ncbi:MAG: intermembrane transport protein PqiB [Neisseria sp.]|nr:intermembrane transport protein PqiB [Neisseria sp.]
MSDNAPKPVPSKVRKTNSFASLVWLIPLIAVITGSWLLFDNIRNTGPEITLLVDSAEGIEVNNTAVRVLNVEVGRVNKIRLREDLQGVELKVRLRADAADLMRTDTQFWIVKPRIDQSGVSGLNTLVSGAYIAFTPGKAEETRYEFRVADIPPIAAIGQNGIRLRLSGDNSKMLEAGSPVMYEGFSVGVVESAKFDTQTRRVDYTVFVSQPNDKLINKSSQFWLQSGISVQAGSNGVKVDGLALPALLTGAISFRTPEPQSAAAENNDTFEIYNDRNTIDNLPGERALYYVAFFKQSVRGLSLGAPVDYKGLRIGSVADVPYFEGRDSLNLFQNGWIPVRIRIEPRLMEKNTEPQSKTYWQNAFQTALQRGLTANLAADNLVLGSQRIELSDRPSEKTLKPFSDYHGNIVIASGSGGGLEDLQAQVGKLLDKLNKLPLEKTVGELNGSLAELKATLRSANALIGKPQTQQIPAELNKTLAELRQTLQGVSPDSPVYRDIQNTLASLDKTLRDAQPVLNTLKEKPNALIFNQNSSDPIPIGSR